MEQAMVYGYKVTNNTLSLAESFQELFLMIKIVLKI